MTKQKLQKMTNTQFIHYVMEIGGRTGAMKQLLIVDAIQKACDEVIESSDELLKAEEETIAKGKMPLISVNGYIEAAKEIKELFDLKYGSK